MSAAPAAQTPPLPGPPFPGLPARAARLILRHHIESGASVSTILAIVALSAGAMLGFGAAVFAAIGATCISITDQPGPLPRKLRTFLAALLSSSLISLLSGLAGGHLLAMAGVVTLTSLGFAFATAYGRWALVFGISGVLALIIGMAIPAQDPGQAFTHAGLFFAGGAAYALLATGAALLLDDRNRRMVLNETLLAFAAYLRARAGLYDPRRPMRPALAEVIERHGAVMERLQAARDMIFTGAPNRRRRRWIIAMLALLDLYEAVLSSDADWEALREVADPGALAQLGALSAAVAEDLEALALALVSGGGAEAAARDFDHADLLAALDATLAGLGGAAGRAEAATALAPTRTKLARATRRTRALAEALAARADPAATVAPAPEPPPVALAAFVQPPAPLWSTARGHLRATSPVMRYTIRLTLAMLAGYAVTVAFPSYVHGGWVLLTIALIMRASYAITRQRRNDRLAGTLAGCAAAAALIPILPVPALVAVIILAVGTAHAYATVNYRVTSFAASLMALLLLQLLEPQNFFVIDRIVDTLIGAVLSMAFARVLPSWEWNDIRPMVAALIAADRAFAAQALCPRPDDQAYRLTRKRALDAFTGLAMSVRRLSSEPYHDDRRLAVLNDLLAADYLFASDLASVHGMVTARAGELGDDASALLDDAARRVEDSLATPGQRPPPETLRRRGWFELRETDPLTVLRRRLLHIEHSAQRLSAHAGRVTEGEG
ncbi:hypothetical protein U879_12880 [Defluviimonas sp. 20V17]|uniref:Uncharacterized membrane protein YccC n=1 Tax=Allgaiera indica TaxID=765699 RepID=A0AAN4UQR9_9RHOB|nr:FUSC family membrane protein [Allgaiera indica]KDB03309.1 hypothetical protein U879_12880 [Defluviimonas sp. 20V17]GHE00581.1 hypothetical protein GCM10008024_12670 [Allgaiera indica]SDW59405.1 Uncharacterized membrane protein YccC [Allgaiera indica]